MFAKMIRRYGTELALSVTVALILSIILMQRPIIGVADNGDFARIMNSTGLSYITDSKDNRYFGYVNRLYSIGPVIPFGGGYLSTQIPLVLLAVYLSSAITGSSVFDIRFLGILYVLILAAAIFLAVAGIRKRNAAAGIFAAIIFIFVFCDIGYATYFNSLYGEPVSFVFLLLAAGAALMLAYGEKPPAWIFALFCIALAFFAGAKIQNTPAGLLAAIICIRPLRLRRDAAWRGIAAASAAAMAIVSLLCYISVSYEIKVCNKYQSVFYGVLKNSPDPAGDLSELGLDPSLAPLAGTHYFMDKYPIDIRTAEFKNMINESVNPLKIVGFYLRHPGRFVGKLKYAAENGFALKQGFGNYEKYPGVKYKQTYEAFSFWSSFKLKVLPHTLPFICIFFIAFILVLACEYRKAADAETQFLAEFLGFIAATGLMQLILPVIADGDADLSKHLFLFNVCFDIMFTAGLIYLPLKIAATARYLRGRTLERKLRTE